MTAVFVWLFFSKTSVELGFHCCLGDHSEYINLEKKGGGGEVDVLNGLSISKLRGCQWRNNVKKKTKYVH